MLTKMRFFVVLLFVVTVGTITSLKLNMRPVVRKSSSIAKTQVAVAKMTLSIALLFGLPAISSGKIASCHVFSGVKTHLVSCRR